jgi:hypothetical protein
MGNADNLGHWVRSLLWGALLLACPIQGQTLWPGMDPYLEMSLVPRPDTTPTVYLTNLYDSPLVAVSWDYKCNGSRWTRHRGFLDAALAYSEPWPKGAVVGTSAAGVGCKGGITAVVFADGRELGDAQGLKQIHDRRRYAREEMRLILDEGILGVPPSQWDPEQSLTKLQARIAQLPEPTSQNIDEVDQDKSTLQDLIRSIEDYRSEVKANPNVYLPRTGKYIENLQRWEQGLASTSYPSTTFRWKP